MLWTEDTWRYAARLSTCAAILTLRRRMFLNPVRGRVRLLGTHLPEAACVGICRDGLRARRLLGSRLSVREKGRLSRLSPRFSLHVNELSLATLRRHAGRRPGHDLVEPSSTIMPSAMPWAS